MDGTAQPTGLIAGDVLAGKYRVERVLGQGAMGIVVAARHLELGELFAVKLLLPETLGRPQAVERFLREARAAARLKSEHVARVTDVGRLEDGSPFMIMEHLTGSDLQQIVRARGPLSVADAVTYTLQVCDALAEAHALGIVHRDMKPSNLFLTTRPNGTACVKVLDFGISKEAGHGAVDLTGTGEVFGTPLYMAPEQMTRTKDADVRSDIWSLGAVLYEILTGTAPFRATSITEVVARVLQEQALPPSHHRPDLPVSLDAIVLRCLQKRPADRYQRIAELATALHGVYSSYAGAEPRMTPAPPALPAQASVGVRSGEASTLPLLSSGGVPVSGSPPVATESPHASTAAAWGSTGHPSPPRARGIAGPLAIGGALTVTLAAVGLWMVFETGHESTATGAADVVGSRSSTGTADPSTAPSSLPSSGLSVIPTAAAEPTSASSMAPTATAVARPSRQAQSRPPAAKPSTLPAPSPSQPAKKREGID